MRKAVKSLEGYSLLSVFSVCTENFDIKLIMKP